MSASGALISSPEAPRVAAASPSGLDDVPDVVEAVAGLVDPEAIGGLGRAIRDNGAVEGEWTIEANPEDLTPDWLDACADAGINRLSLGIQSMDDAVLEKAGRGHTAAQVVTACRLVKDRMQVDSHVRGVVGKLEAQLTR